MEKAFRAVIEFEKRCGHEPSGKPPAVPSLERVGKRLRLLDEERAELIEAMLTDNVPEIADGIADDIFVLLGTAYHYGIDIATVWDRVCEANLAKFQGDGPIRDSNGKVRKPPGWRHPDIAAILAAQPTLAETYGSATPENRPRIDSEASASDRLIDSSSDQFGSRGATLAAV